METIIAQGLVFPIVVLLVEYLVIQPWLRFRELTLLTSGNVDVAGNGRKWSDGLRLSVKHFKQNFGNYNWRGGVIRQHLVEVSGFSIGRGQAELNLVVKVRYLLDKPRAIAEYKLLIDKIGDILEVETIAVFDPFEGKDLKVPESWLAIGAISLAILICTNSETVGSQQRKGIVNDTPVASLWTQAQASPIFLDSSVNGTVGGNQVVTYVYKSETADMIEITIQPVGDSVLEVLLYNQNNSLVQTSYASSKSYGTGIQLAPEMGASYMILIVATNGDGGSYKLNLQKLQTPTP